MSELNLQSELTDTGIPRTGDSPETAGKDISTRIVELGVVESIEQLCTE